MVVVDTIDLDISEEYTAEVYALKDEDVEEIEERPVIVCTYPAIDITIRDDFGLELLERGFLLVNPIYDDGELYGKTLSLSEVVKKLREKEYCGDVGLYGFSAGGTQVLNFAASTYSDMIEGVLAGCPNINIGAIRA